MLKVIWAEIGMVPRNLRSVAYESEHEIIEVLEFPGTPLIRRDKEILKYWIPKSDVVVICNATSSVSVPIEYRRINDFALALNKSLIRIEWIQNSNDRKFNIVDRPKHFSKELLTNSNISIEDALFYVFDAYDATESGLVLPDNRQLFIFNNVIEVKPTDLVNLLSNSEELQRISPRLFEELVADLLVADGWDVDLVARNNAHGPDIIATTTKNIGNQKQQMIVECKRHREDRPVDIDVVRKVMYWVNDEYRATFGMIATSSRFTSPAAMEVEKRHKWRMTLKDQQALTNWMQNVFRIVKNS